MSADNVTPIDGSAEVPPEGSDGLQELINRLGDCRQTLTCATVALGKAEDESFEGALAPAAIRVVERCLGQLEALEHQFDSYEVKRARSNSTD